MKTHHAALLALLRVGPSSIHGFSTPSASSFALRSKTHDVATPRSFHVESVLYSAVSEGKSDSAEKDNSVNASSSTSTSTSKQTDEDLIASFEQPDTAKILTKAIPYSELTIGVSKETFKGENRVSLTPDNVETLVKAGFQVVIQSGAGVNASFSDAAYIEKGASVLLGEQFFASSDIITKIRPPSEEEVPKLAGKTLIGMISPSINTDLYESLAEQNTNVFALDCVPRMLSRAQSYDVLSSQANIAGYRAVVEAAEEFPRFFAGQMTAAGKVPPAKVLVLGAGTHWKSGFVVVYRL